MKRTNKKGFTIVELVIVIAVVAVLAAVLIPTFVSLTNKANQSADIQAARQMTEVLASEPNTNTVEVAVNVLAENGYNAKKALIPISTGHGFYYNTEENAIWLVNEEDNTVVYPKKKTFDAGKCVNLGDNYKHVDIVAGDKETFRGAIENGNINVTLNTDITVAERTIFTDVAELDLNGKNITGNFNDGTNSAAGKSILTFLSDATISGDGKVENTNEDGIAVTIIDLDGGSNTVTINDGTYISNNVAVYVWSGNLVINGGHFETTNEDTRYVLNTLDQNRARASITVNGGTFVNFNPAESPCGEGEITLGEGCTVTAQEQENGDIWYIVTKG